ncbi:MAG TPA: hypothetical protein DCG34_11815 [Clostridiales bacterium]|jgi:hypothetical protein|nr:hypothetical protein [Clostridiales bacterium]
MVRRIEVTLEQYEYSALLEMANEELRNPSDQLRHIFRLEMDRRNKNDLVEITEHERNEDGK